MLKIDANMRIVCLDSGMVYGSLFRGEDGLIHFRKSWYIEDIANCEQKQIDKILEEVNYV